MAWGETLTGHRPKPKTPKQKQKARENKMAQLLALGIIATIILVGLELLGPISIIGILFGTCTVC